MKKTKIVLERILELIALISFIILAVIVAQKHEPWADEAQAWLLARDTSIVELLTQYMKYDGSPPLWHLILKGFMQIGFTYENYYIIPIIFSAIGLAIIELKTKIPIYLKLVIPFTYYIFYQYTIIARNYCLILPIIMLIALVYNNKTKKPFIFGLLIFLLLNISSHMYIFAASLSLIYGLQVLNETYKVTTNKTLEITKKDIIKNWIVIILLLISFAITALFLIPQKDHSEGFKNSKKETLEYVGTIMSDALVTNSQNIKECFIVTAVALLVIVLSYWNDKRIFECIIMILPVYLFLTFFYCNKWHIGIIFEILLFAFIVHKRLENNYFLPVIFTMVCAIQANYTYKTSIYDYKYMYSAAGDIAAFIENNTYQNKVIYGVGYNATAVEAYFDENIFANRLNNKAFYIWKKGDPEYMSQEEMKDNLPDILIISIFSSGDYFSLINRVKVSQLYERYYFEGTTYVKNKIYESEGFWVYVSKNILKENQNSEIVVLDEK